jgi:hypothetical protein
MEIAVGSALLIGLAAFGLAYLVRLSIKLGEWFWRRRRERLQGRR